MIGSGAGDCAPAPSHTTGRAVFRIRRLNSAAHRRKIGWHNETEVSKDRVGQGSLHTARCRDAPRTPGAGSHLQQPASHPQAAQLSLASLAAMPPQPETLPDVPPYPTFQPVNRRSVLSQLEVSPPALNEASPAISQLVAGHALTASPEFPHPRFESLDAFRCDSDLQFAIQSKAEELAFLSPPCAAFGGIHLQSQMLLDPALYRTQRAFRRHLTACVDIAVIGVPAEAVPPPFQFLVERIQIDVGQQR